ncbi:MAG: hypothetical protein GEU97_08780 [Actinophytocola sp.]|nr:hypothetical protein [Actinophytocola sp.]
MTAKAARRTISLIAATAASGALLLTLAAPTAASGPPLAASGEGVITSVEETSSRDADGNRIAERRLEGFLTGTLEGTFVEEVRGVVHDNGQVTFQGTLEFTGTVGECGDGTVHGRLSGKGTAGENPRTEARATLVDHASSTVDAAGTGVVVQDGPFLTYDIQYSCR